MGRALLKTSVRYDVVMNYDFETCANCNHHREPHVSYFVVYSDGDRLPQYEVQAR